MYISHILNRCFHSTISVYCFLIMHYVSCFWLSKHQRSKWFELPQSVYLNFNDNYVGLYIWKGIIGTLGGIWGILFTCCKYISDVSKYLDLQDENVHTLINDAKKWLSHLGTAVALSKNMRRVMMQFSIPQHCEHLTCVFTHHTTDL